MSENPICEAQSEEIPGFGYLTCELPYGHRGPHREREDSHVWGGDDLRERVARAIAGVECERPVSDIDWAIFGERSRESYRAFADAAIAEMRDRITPREPREQGWRDVLSAHDTARLEGFCCCSACLLEAVERAR